MVSKPGRGGLSVLETLIATAMTLIAVYFLSRLVQSTFLGSERAARDYQAKSSANTVVGSLQKSIASGDTIFFGFSGRGTASPPDKPTLRMLIPLPGHCATLSTATCSGDAAYLYTHYDKTATPAVSAVCAIDDRTVLINLGDTTYGQAQNGLPTGGTGFTVVPSPTNTHVSGPVAVTGNTLMALMTPPVATLWLATGPPVPYVPPTYDPISKTFSPAFNPLSNCGAYLQPASGAPPVLGELYTVPVRALLLGQFTGGSTLPAADAVSWMGRFPQRFFNAEVRSIGMVTDASGQRAFGILPCQGSVVGGSTQISCAGPSKLFVPHARAVRFRQSFKLPLLPVPAPAPDNFELIGAGQTVSLSCQAPRCVGLLIANASQLRGYFNASETSLVSLQAGGFSVLKQEALSHINIVLTLANPSRPSSASTTEEVYDVAFP